VNVDREPHRPQEQNVRRSTRDGDRGNSVLRIAQEEKMGGHDERERDERELDVVDRLPHRCARRPPHIERHVPRGPLDLRAPLDLVETSTMLALASGSTEG
jgi:hypothetical protein